MTMVLSVPVGVADKVCEHADQKLTVAAKQYALLRLTFQFDSVLFNQRQILAGIQHQRAEIQCFHGIAVRAVFQPGKCEHIVDEAGHALRLPVNHPHRFAVFFLGAVLFQRILTLRQNDRHRRAEFMRSIGRKLPFPLQTKRPDVQTFH